MKKAPAVSYLRVSGKAQAGADKDGFPRQREAVTAFAKAHGYEILDEYRDEGISGTLELENRPALTALLARIKGNGVRVVIVERADRLARDLMAGEIILRELAKYDARVLTSDGQDLSAIDDDPTRTLIRQVLGAVAQFEKAVLVAKLRGARQRKRKTGVRVEGVRPFGSQKEEAEAIARMHALHREGVSLAGIARALNAEGIQTRSQRIHASAKTDKSRPPRPWSKNIVAKILRRVPPKKRGQQTRRARSSP